MREFAGAHAGPCRGRFTHCVPPPPPRAATGWGIGGQRTQYSTRVVLLPYALRRASADRSDVYGRNKGLGTVNVSIASGHAAFYGHAAGQRVVVDLDLLVGVTCQITLTALRVP